MKIGIIGCGAMAKVIKKYHPEITYFYDTYADKCETLGTVCKNIESLIENVDLIIEAASTDAVRQYAMKVVSEGKDLLIMSVGALIDDSLRNSLFAKARESGARIYIPSGAIGGMDLVKAARIGGISYARIRTIKNPKTLGVSAKERTLVFKGNAKQAIERFPKSTNVTVLLTIVSGVDVDVEVYADPNTQNNVHEIHVEGAFGTADFTIRNKPSEDNPKTSYLAALSPLSIINLIDSPVMMGV